MKKIKLTQLLGFSAFLFLAIGGIQNTVFLYISITLFASAWILGETQKQPTLNFLIEELYPVGVTAESTKLGRTGTVIGYRRFAPGLPVSLIIADHKQMELFHEDPKFIKIVDNPPQPHNPSHNDKY